MYPQRAIFLALDAMFRVDDTHGYRWEVDPRLPGLLRDFQALGFHLIGILDPMAFGLDLETATEKLEIVAYVNSVLAASGAPELSAVQVSSDIADPRPIWELRQRFHLSLRRSILVGSSALYEQLLRNSDIGRMEWAHDLFGPAYDFAVAG